MHVAMKKDYNFNNTIRHSFLFSGDTAGFLFSGDTAGIDKYRELPCIMFITTNNKLMHIDLGGWACVG